MPRFAAVLLFLVCGLFLVALVYPVVAVILGTATLGRVGPDSYLPFLLLLSLSAYGFYASCNVLFAYKPETAQEDPEPVVAGLDSKKPARRLGWGLATFGLIAMVHVWPQLYSWSNPWTGDSPMTIFDYGPILCLAFGSLLAYAFRRRTTKA